MKVFKVLKDILYGMFYFDTLMTVRKEKYECDLALISVLYSDFLGVPTLQPIYRLKVLPYLYPLIDKWKINSIKEYDITDKIKE